MRFPLFILEVHDIILVLNSCIGDLFLSLALSPRLPTFINFRTKEFQSHHKADCVLHANAHVAVELSVLVNTGFKI